MTALHERVFLVAIEMTETPRVHDENRVTVKFGFMEKADVTQGLQVAVVRGQIAPCDLTQVTYFSGHETIMVRCGGAKPFLRTCITMHSNPAPTSIFQARR
jgi:K+ transporter